MQIQNNPSIFQKAYIRDPDRQTLAIALSVIMIAGAIIASSLAGIALAHPIGNVMGELSSGLKLGILCGTITLSLLPTIMLILQLTPHPKVVKEVQELEQEIQELEQEIQELEQKIEQEGGVIERFEAQIRQKTQTQTEQIQNLKATHQNALGNLDTRFENTKQNLNGQINQIQESNDENDISERFLSLTEELERKRQAHKEEVDQKTREHEEALGQLRQDHQAEKSRLEGEKGELEQRPTCEELESKKQAIRELAEKKGGLEDQLARVQDPNYLDTLLGNASADSTTSPPTQEKGPTPQEPEIDTGKVVFLQTTISGRTTPFTFAEKSIQYKVSYNPDAAAITIQKGNDSFTVLTGGGDLIFTQKNEEEIESSEVCALLELVYTKLKDPQARGNDSLKVICAHLAEHYNDASGSDLIFTNQNETSTYQAKWCDGQLSIWERPNEGDPKSLELIIDVDGEIFMGKYNNEEGIFGVEKDSYQSLLDAVFTRCQKEADEGVKAVSYKPLFTKLQNTTEDDPKEFTSNHEVYVIYKYTDAFGTHALLRTEYVIQKKSDWRDGKETGLLYINNASSLLSFKWESEENYQVLPPHAATKPWLSSALKTWTNADELQIDSSLSERGNFAPFVSYGSYGGYNGGELNSSEESSDDFEEISVIVEQTVSNDSRKVFDTMQMTTLSRAMDEVTSLNIQDPSLFEDSRTIQQANSNAVNENLQVKTHKNSGVELTHLQLKTIKQGGQAQTKTRNALLFSHKRTNYFIWSSNIYYNDSIRCTVKVDQPIIVIEERDSFLKAASSKKLSFTIARDGGNEGKLLSIFENNLSVNPNNTDAVLKNWKEVVNAGLLEAIKAANKFSADRAVIRIDAVRYGVPFVAEHHLSQLINYVDGYMESHNPMGDHNLPDIRVTFKTQNLQTESGIDAGGLTRAYIDLLCSNLFETGVLERNPKHLLPKLREGSGLRAKLAQEHLYQKLGKLIMLAYRKPAGMGTYQYHFTTGLLFSDTVYKIAFEFSRGELLGDFNSLTWERLLPFYEQLATVKEDFVEGKFLKVLQEECWNDRSNDATQETYKDLAIVSIYDVYEWVFDTEEKLTEAIEDYDDITARNTVIPKEDIQTAQLTSYLKRHIRETYDPYLFAIHALAKGMRDYVLNINNAAPLHNSQYLGSHFEVQPFMNKAQGVLNRGQIVASFQMPDQSTVPFRQKITWLQEWIQNDATEAELAEMIRFITGSASLRPEDEITLRMKNDGNPLPAGHACNSQLDIEENYICLPSLRDDDKENFLIAFKAGALGGGQSFTQG